MTEKHQTPSQSTHLPGERHESEPPAPFRGPVDHHDVVDDLAVALEVLLKIPYLVGKAAHEDLRMVGRRPRDVDRPSTELMVTGVDERRRLLRVMGQLLLTAVVIRVVPRYDGGVGLRVVMAVGRVVAELSSVVGGCAVRTLRPVAAGAGAARAPRGRRALLGVVVVRDADEEPTLPRVMVLAERRPDQLLDPGDLPDLGC